MIFERYVPYYHHHRTPTLIVIFLIVIIVFVTVWLIGFPLLRGNNNFSAGNTTETMRETDAKWYHNTEHHFSFRYPSKFTLEEEHSNLYYKNPGGKNIPHI